MSAIFESVDAAESAARRVRDAGIAVRRRRVTALRDERDAGPRLPTDALYFPAAARFPTGTDLPSGLEMPGMEFYPMAGRLSREVPPGGEARLELEAADEAGSEVCELLRSMHGTEIRRGGGAAIL